MTLVRTALAFAVSALIPLSANAWERTVTCYDDPTLGMPCGEGESPIALAWTDACIGLHLNEASMAGLGSADSMRAVLQRSAAVWNDVSDAWISVLVAGATDETRVGFSQGCGTGSNANIVALIEDDWAHARAALALTTVTYYPTNGRILDADIELNGENYEFSIVTVPLTAAGKNDLENTLTHEIGHLLGIDHTREGTFERVGAEVYSDATMFAETDGGEISKRTLIHDDEEALRAAYPDETTPDGECSVNNADFAAPATPPGTACPHERRGCAAVDVPVAPAVFVLFALLLLRRRRLS